MDDDEICAVVRRLARPHASGGEVIERSVILAEGSESAAIMTWILEHSGVADSTTAGISKGGLHASREQTGLGGQGRPPLRFILPAGAFD
jgi:hypothetical protein